MSQFFGRQKLLTDLEKYLLRPQQQHEKPTVVVLQALGGQGKSQIALELCRKLRKDYRGIFWLDATSKASVERSFEEIAEVLNKPAIRLLEDTEGKVTFVLDTIQDWNERWLVVYDNYDRPDIFHDIRKFIPQSESIYVITSPITNRARRIGWSYFYKPTRDNESPWATYSSPVNGG